MSLIVTKFQPFNSLGHSSYRILTDNEDKYICEVPVDPIFMLHTDKIAVKVLKNTVTITSNGQLKKKTKWIWLKYLLSFGKEKERIWKWSQPRLEIEQACYTTRGLQSWYNRCCLWQEENYRFGYTETSLDKSIISDNASLKMVCLRISLTIQSPYTMW